MNNTDINMQSSNKSNENNPLVSIIVITYNSSKYVLETLESAKAQTYQNIELIVSDDSSQDNTVEICKNWIEVNKERFVRTELVTVEKNTGIAANCNRGIKSSKGSWFKIIAGDDILFEKCIAIYIEATRENSEKFFFSKFNVLSDDINKKVQLENSYEKNYILFQGNQFDNLMNNGYFLPSITFFGNTFELIKVGLFNEDYPFQEDFPMWFKILKKGYQFCFINRYTVVYRIHGDSIYNNKLIANKKWHKSFKKFFYKEMLPERIRRKQYLKAWDFIMHLLYIDLTILFGNKKGFIDNCCKTIRVLSPLYAKNTFNRLFKIFKKY